MYPEKNSQIDANWSPDGKRIAFGRNPFIPNSADVIDIRILDVSSTYGRERRAALSSLATSTIAAVSGLRPPSPLIIRGS